MFVAVACGDGSDAERTSEPTEVADQAVETPERDPTPTEVPDDAGAHDDPREVLLELAEAGRQEDFEFVYDHLSERFHVIRYDEMWVRGLAPRIETFEHVLDRPPSVDDFEVEAHEKFTVVRFPELPGRAFVFRAENGGWRLDPGDHVLARSAAMSLPQHQRGGSFLLSSNDGVQVEWDFEGVGEIILPVHQWPMTIAMLDGAAEITVSWQLDAARTVRPHEQFDGHLQHDALAPLDGITWHAGGESGPVEIVWTDAILENDQLRFPGWSDVDFEELMGQQPETLPGLFYHATLRLEGLPDGVEEIVVRVEEFHVGPLGEDAPIAQDEPLVITFENYIPARTNAGVLVGEPPDYGEDSGIDETPDPVPHDQLPPGPPVEDFEVVEAEYDRSGDRVEARILVDTHGSAVEFLGDTLVEWDDGETTYPSIVMTEGSVEFTTEREGAPDQTQVVAVRLDGLARSLEPDPDAVFHEDRIETRWGTFPIINIVSDDDGSATIHYGPAGQRWIRSIEFEHDGQAVLIRAASSSFDEDFQPQNLSINTNPAFGAAREGLPLQAEVEVWEAGPGVTIEIR